MYGQIFAPPQTAQSPAQPYNFESVNCPSGHMTKSEVKLMSMTSHQRRYDVILAPNAHWDRCSLVPVPATNVDTCRLIWACAVII